MEPREGWFLSCFYSRCAVSTSISEVDANTFCCIYFSNPLTNFASGGCLCGLISLFQLWHPSWASWPCSMTTATEVEAQIVASCRLHDCAANLPLRCTVPYRFGECQRGVLGLIAEDQKNLATIHWHSLIRSSIRCRVVVHRSISVIDRSAKSLSQTSLPFFSLHI
jgi:hypothetical protein